MCVTVTELFVTQASDWQYKRTHCNTYVWLVVQENCVAVMIAILRQMTEAHYQDYINSFPTTFDLLDFLMEILMVFRDLVGRSVYPPDWLEMIMLQNR